MSCFSKLFFFLFFFFFLILFSLSNSSNDFYVSNEHVYQTFIDIRAVVSIPLTQTRKTLSYSTVNNTE